MPVCAASIPGCAASSAVASTTPCRQVLARLLTKKPVTQRDYSAKQQMTPAIALFRIRPVTIVMPDMAMQQNFASIA
jgi:hypothetical protein